MGGKIALQPGLAFRPSDNDLITLFLCPKIAKMPFEQRIINNEDVYSADPAELVGRHRRAMSCGDNFQNNGVHHHNNIIYA
ncbi:hypothetical protein E2562_005803 [Oryza meyeriana var. granulata]|uniref:NAC domain-containing protein n=1 Tax=Oryza meyeriana var. granulata TaxID=110450 RepID=A0A6G1F4L4_9ORYZ|nr:hypothetical protein E2562_005803 [Oryza meyeriana var. granulata]